jgi:hypothetical protein
MAAKEAALRRRFGRVNRAPLMSAIRAFLAFNLAGVDE